MDDHIKVFLRGRLNKQDISLSGGLRRSHPSPFLLESRQICVEKTFEYIHYQKGNRIILRGGLGTGKRTVLEEVIRSLIESDYDFSASDILYFKVSQHCCIESLYQFFGDLSKECSLQQESVILARSDSKDEERRKALNRVSKMYKLVCLDGIDNDGGEIWNFLQNVVDDQTILLATDSAFHLHDVGSEDRTHVIVIPILNFNESLQFAKNLKLNTEQGNAFIDDTSFNTIHMMSKGNPFSMILLLNAWKNIDPIIFIQRLLCFIAEAGTNSAIENGAFLVTIAFLMKHFSTYDRNLLSRECEKSNTVSQRSGKIRTPVSES